MNRFLQNFAACALLVAGLASGVSAESVPTGVQPDTLPTLAVESLQIPLQSVELADGQSVSRGETVLEYIASEPARRITAQLDQDLPSGVRLELEVLDGAASAGAKTLSHSPTTVALNIPASTEGRIRIRCQLSINFLAPPGAYARAITFHLQNL